MSEFPINGDAANPEHPSLRARFGAAANDRLLSAYDRVVTALMENGSQAGAHDMWGCPAHNDRTPSLHVTNGSRGVLLKCFAGCPVDRIAENLGLHLSELFDETTDGRFDPGPQATPTRVLIAEYKYL